LIRRLFFMRPFLGLKKKVIFWKYGQINQTNTTCFLHC
jgi:hypothetical protein